MAPSVAWNDASRRSVVICIFGFFVPNLLAEFGVVPQLHQAFHFMPGICGAAGAYFAALALFIGYYHQKTSWGAVLAVCAFALPYSATWLWFRLSHPSNSAGLLQLCGPTCIAAIAAYAFLIRWHAGESQVTIESLIAQLAEDKYGTPTSRSQQMIVRASVAVGFVLALLVLLAAVATRN